MKRRKSTPLMLFWSKAEQKRFIDAVERLVSTTNDLRMLLLEQREERSERARRANRTRQAAAAEEAAQVVDRVLGAGGPVPTVDGCGVPVGGETNE